MSLILVRSSITLEKKISQILSTGPKFINLAAKMSSYQAVWQFIEFIGITSMKLGTFVLLNNEKIPFTVKKANIIAGQEFQYFFG